MRTVIVILSAVAAAWAQLSVNTPVGVATCQNSLITWSGGSDGDSYIVQIASSPSGDVIEAYTGITSTSYNWFVNLPANTQFFVRLLTITRKTAESGVVTVQAGATQSCTGTTATIPVAPITVTNTSPSAPQSSPPAPDASTSTTADPASPSPTSISSLSSGSSSTSVSRSLTLVNNSTSLSGGSGDSSSTSTLSGLNGASGSTVDTTGSGSSSGSPNIGVIVGAATGGSVALVLLLLVVCLYYRRKRSTKRVEQTHSIETKPGGAGGGKGVSRVDNPYFPGYSGYSSTPFVPPLSSSYPGTNSPDSSEAAMMSMGQSLHSEPRMTSGSDAVVPVTTTVGRSTSTPAATPLSIPVGSPSQIIRIPNTTPGPTTEIPGPIDDFPPMYWDEDEARIESQRIRTEEAERARLYDALISDFCASNRDLISPVLERKLHAARYLPSDNPSDVPLDYWHNTYGVEFFELRRLQTAYDRNVATQALINMPEKALPQAALSAKEKAMHPYRQAGRP